MKMHDYVLDTVNVLFPPLISKIIQPKSNNLVFFVKFPEFFISSHFFMVFCFGFFEPMGLRKFGGEI